MGDSELRREGRRRGGTEVFLFGSLPPASYATFASRLCVVCTPLPILDYHVLCSRSILPSKLHARQLHWHTDHAHNRPPLCRTRVAGRQGLMVLQPAWRAAAPCPRRTTRGSGREERVCAGRRRGPAPPPADTGSASPRDAAAA